MPTAHSARNVGAGYRLLSVGDREPPFWLSAQAGNNATSGQFWDGLRS
jgi:hypothetical protein